MEMDTEDWELLPIPNQSCNTLDIGPKETDLAFVDNHYFPLPSQPPENQELVEGAKEDGSSPLAEFKDTGVVIIADLHVFKNSKDDMNAAEPPSFSSENEAMDEEGEQVDHDAKGEPCREGLGLKAWSWKLAGGVGALCSAGVAAAAAVCVLAALGGRQQPRHEPQFQIYAEEKRIKQVVQQATRLNHALTAVRGAPMTTTTANISFGGYYNGL